MALSKLHDIKKPLRHGSVPTNKVLDTSIKTSKRPPVTSPRQYHHRSQKNSGGGKGLWYLAFILVVGLFFGLSVFFTQAEIIVTPIVENIPLNERFISHEKSISQDLTFDTMVVEGSVSQSLTSNEKQKVEERARGFVRIYNDSGNQAQPLRIDTRLIDEKGRIYKTVKAVTVPGQKMTGGQLTPGVVDVEIYADNFGEEYNESKEEITLRFVGFQESKNPKFETIYAKTLGIIEGGYVGERYVIPQDEKDAIILNLTEKLTNDLFEKSMAQMPNHVIFPKKLSVLMDKKVTENVDESGSVTLTLSAKLFNVLFNKIEFEKYILATSIVGVSQETAYISNIHNLNIVYVDEALQTINPESLENLAFQIEDNLEIISIVNKESLAFELVGQKRKDFQSIISKHPGIKSVEYDIDPFWRSRFPDKDEDIKIILTTE